MSIVCLIFSKFVLSSCLIAIIILIVLLNKTENGYHIGVNKELFRWAIYKDNVWPFTGYVLYFLWIVFSILWSQNTGAWFHDAVGKLGILAIAFIFVFLPRLTPKEVSFLHHVLYLVMGFSLLSIFFIYVPAYEDITLRIGRGRPIPMPIDHVRFSIITAYSAISSLAIFLFSIYRKANKYIYLVVGILFFICTHILAVRTGIMLLYLGVGILLIYFILISRKYLIGLILLIITIVSPIIAYNTVDSFRNKVWYTKHDIHQLIINDGDNYSDGDRVRSIKNGIQLWKEHILLGYGAGDYKNASNEYYFSKNQEGKILLPHNQFVRSGMAYGAIGFILLLIGFIFALFYNRGYKNILLVLIIATFFFSLFVESNLERYYALVFFFLFIGINGSLSKSNSIINNGKYGRNSGFN